MPAAARSRNYLRLAKLDPAVSAREIERIVSFEEDEPFDILGPHLLEEESAVIVRCYLPGALHVWVKRKSRGRQKMVKAHEKGFFFARFESETGFFSYTLVCEYEDGTQREFADPYAIFPDLQDSDIYLYNQGNHFRSYEKLGAHLKTLQEREGVQFAVWAPTAKSVSVAGNFNHWNAGEHPMTRIHFSGLWALFIPGIQEGEVYKYAVKIQEGRVQMKADPYAFHAELRPRTASKVASLNRYSWKDETWMTRRPQSNPLESPLSIYEVHLGSWKKDEKTGKNLNYREIARKLVNYAHNMGYTHLELMPVMEHPLDESWGYQVAGYYAPTSRFGTPEDFMFFVDYCHRHGIGVLLDWVPGHFPKDEHGLIHFDGAQIYAYQDWRKGEHREWGTLIFDYGRNEVQNFLISNALFWLDRYHIDGLRVDAVASMLYLDYSRKAGEWEPNPFGGRENLEAVAFLKKFNETVHANFPGVLTVAEESTAWPGVSRPTYLNGLGFSLKWNMGWMHDTLAYFSKDPIYRKHHQDMLTFSLLYAFTENFILPISHDEVVYGKRSLLEKMPGDEWQKFANLRLFLGYMFAHPGKKLLFMGNEIAQRQEWNSLGTVDWHLLEHEQHRGLSRFIKDLNQVYRTHPALYEEDFKGAGFEWIDFSDSESSVLTFLRRSHGGHETLAAACNMTPVPRMNYRIGVPEKRFYREILNSDAKEYGGSGIGNWGGAWSEEIPWQGRPYSLNIHFPPLGIVFLKPE
jgi:1,4-alpha-glucan branching enzyme